MEVIDDCVEWKALETEVVVWVQIGACCNTSLWVCDPHLGDCIDDCVE